MQGKKTEWRQRDKLREFPLFIDFIFFYTKILSITSDTYKSFPRDLSEKIDIARTRESFASRQSF